MKGKFLLPGVLLCLVIVSLATFADLSGNWSGPFRGLDGNIYTLTYNFKVDGNKLTGTAGWPEGTVSIDEGKVNGSDLTFKLNFDGEIIPHTGKYYQDSVAMDIVLNDQKMHFVLKRGK